MHHIGFGRANRIMPMDEPLTLLDLPDLLESFLSSRSVEFSVSAVCAFAYLSADFDFRVAALGS